MSEALLGKSRASQEVTFAWAAEATSLLPTQLG